MSKDVKELIEKFKIDQLIDWYKVVCMHHQQEIINI